MEGERYRLGPARRLLAEAIGQPGQRTFRIMFGTDTQTACLWLEKEQIQALALAIDQFVAQLRAQKIASRSSEGEVTTAEPGEFDFPPTIEFKVSRLGLGYDEQNDHLVVMAYELEADEDGPATLSVATTRAQARHLSKSIGDVIAAGRPRCPLCGTPLTSGPHACPPSNGHHPQPISR